MSRLLVAGVAAVAAAVSPVAAAVDLPGPPAVTTPTVTTPAVTTPAITTPTVTTPTPTITTPAVSPLPPLPGPAPAPPVPRPPVTTPTKPAAVPSPAVTAPAPGGAPSTPPSQPAPVVAPVASPFTSPVTSVVVGARSARSSAAQTPRRRRPAPVVTRFRLVQPALVRIVVGEEAPVCRPIGRYAVRASRGVNALRVRRRLGGHRLGAGTYRLVGTVRGATVLDVRFRLAFSKGAPRVRHDGLADACGPATFAASSQPTVSSATGAAAGVPAGEKHRAAPSAKSKTSFLPPVLHALDATRAPLAVRAMLFALLAGAIVLLAAGSLPEGIVAGAPVVGIVSRRRRAVTLAGAALLVAALLVTLFA